MTGILIKRGNTHTHTHTHTHKCNEKMEADIRMILLQAMELQIASNLQEARERHGTHGQSSEGANPADTSISGIVRQYIIVL